ncbi:hypothetical protein AB5J72_41525 [Streptomyces sp. CG1]|uniref:hypothetical protein n=1 Tax=Streptomyces sp. CG1 TaxID=1287523 RepID=UPI0034E22D64
MCRQPHRGLTTWLLSGDSASQGLTVARMRITDRAGSVEPDDLGVHPGRDWFTVLTSTVVLYFGSRVIHVEVEAGQAASFSTMTPHPLRADRGPAAILCILDHNGERNHRHPDT